VRGMVWTVRDSADEMVRYPTAASVLGSGRHRARPKLRAPSAEEVIVQRS